MSPTPKRQPMIKCPHCGSENDPARGSKYCRNCQLPLSGQLAPFQFPSTGQTVRTVLRDGEPWFVAADVCAVLGHSNHRVAVGRLPERMKGVTEVDTPGGPQDMRIVSEPGVYRLVM